MAISGLATLATNDTNETTIANAGTLTVSACNLHTANGGCAITNSGTATVSNSDFAGVGELGIYAPGAIDNTGTMTISNSVFEGFFLYPTIAAVIANYGVLTVNYTSRGQE